MNRVIFGDCRESMRGLIAQSVKVQMCVTSPPYFGLRDYGHPGQLGLEQTPDEYIANMVEVFRLVRELLSDDGVLWLNIGDSYATRGGKNQTPMCGDIFQRRERGKSVVCKSKRLPLGSGRWGGGNNAAGGEIKPKDLIGIPWMLVFALRADGWYLRQDIIWHKPNPMPESVTDRCTKAHEYMFLLSKSERYYFDNKAISEPVALSTVCSLSQDVEHQEGSERVPGKTNGNMKAVGDLERRNRRSVWTIPTVPYKGAHFATFPPALVEPCILAGSRANDIVLDPFFGSGTTGQVAQNLGRQWIGCELNQDYAQMQNERLAQSALMFEAAA